MLALVGLEPGPENGREQVGEGGVRDVRQTTAFRRHLKPQGAHADIKTSVDALVAAGVEEGVIAKDAAAILAIMLRGSIRSVIVERLATGGAFPDDSDAVVSLMLDGARIKR